MGARDQLTFDSERHEYRHLGRVVPGVTSVLAPLVDFSRVPREVLEAKRDLGRRVHEACHYFDEDDLDEESVEGDVEPYLEAWKRFKVETGARVISCERRVFHPTFGYAGTLDRVLELDGMPQHRGMRWLTDLKTSIATPAAVGPQTAAYLAALNDPSVTHRAALRLRDDGTYRFDPLTGADDWSVFLSCLTVRRFLEKHQ